MEITWMHFIILGVLSGLTKGAGVLPDGPLNATVGETVMFTTTLTPSETPFVSVDWSFVYRFIITSNTVNITEPEYEGRITLFIDTGSLQLRNVGLTDRGKYTVTIVPSGGRRVEGNIELSVYVPVSNVKATANTTDLVEFISSVRLSCSSSGSPPFSFLWLNGTSEVTASDGVQLTDGGSSLTILNVTCYDQGPFKCHVSNPVSNNISDPVKLSFSYNSQTISHCSIGCIARAIITSLVVVGTAVGGACYIYAKKKANNAPALKSIKEQEENEHENISVVYDNI